MEKQQPTVSVGIMSDVLIDITLHGKFKIWGVINGEIWERDDWRTCGGHFGVNWNSQEKVQFDIDGIQTWFWDALYFEPLDDNCSFTLHGVTIGVSFHWRRKEDQTFKGTLKFIVENGKLTAINIVPVEDYLTSVISSEMSAKASLELLKAHAVISRSWLLAQIQHKPAESSKADSVMSDLQPSLGGGDNDENIRWWDRDDHVNYDVCADDHCQRYQGITRASTPAVEQAIAQTWGEVLMHGGQLCDARFSKSCGGVLEEFENCWQDHHHDYLVARRDGDNEQDFPDLTREDNAAEWILSSPTAFCNTHDPEILSQVLNDYDQETPDFYHWTVEYTQAQLSELINRKLKDDFGLITDLIPLERGKSGRIWKLKIVGTKKTFTIGKELEIRRALSETHLLSSAFDVEHEGDCFRLHGKGWGHGVGLCQIGAAVMGEQGKTYDEILLFYYRNAEIQRLYD